MNEPNKELVNSRRRFEKTTYTPVKTRQMGEGGTGDALPRAALIRGLTVTPAELAVLREQELSSSEQEALHAVAQLMASSGADPAIRAAASLANIPDAGLIAIAERLEAQRAGLIERLSEGVKELSRTYDQFQHEQYNSGDGDQTEPTAGEQAPMTQSIGASPAADDFAKDGSETDPAMAADNPVIGPPPNQGDLPPLSEAKLSSTVDIGRPAFTATALLQPSPAAFQLATAHPFTAATFGTIGASRLPTVLTWAAQEMPDRLESLLNEARPYLPRATASSVVDLVGSIVELENRRGAAQRFITALTQRPLEPVGLLHLERLEMTPIEIERGELLYSLPLAPHEKVTMAHKEWTTREEEFSRYVQDFFENFSETGVAEADDIALSSLTQTRHANALSMSQTPVGSSGVSITNAADGTGQTSTVEDMASIEQSRNHARTVTSKATARSIKDHKVSFTVTTVSGVEDFTARVLENTYDDKAMRIDYFRRMRRWRTDLYRYGVRMTYDVVLPDPGRHLRRRHEQIQAIDKELASGSQFTLKPSQITVMNWQNLADAYGTNLEPPREVRRFEVVRQIDYGPAELVKIRDVEHIRQKLEELQVDVPSDYQLSSMAATVQLSTWHVDFAKRWITLIGDGLVRSFVSDNLGYINGAVNFDPRYLPENGAIKVIFQSQYVSNGVLKLSGTIKPREAVVEDWRMRCWTRLRDAANAARTRRHDELRAKRAVLEREIASMDVLTLRRMEREQIMLLVLTWLFPEFDESVGSLYDIALPGSWETGVWQEIMKYGEYIKFVHEAIDWDNVMVFLFPYFWDKPGNHEGKLFLHHNDPLHREFLRAGAAQVVLAIRPGFEEEITSLLDQGQLGQLPNGHRFKKIAEDVHAANAEYVRQTEADKHSPNHDNPRIPGTLIGSWYDYTPTGALDIDVITSNVQSS